MRNLFWKSLEAISQFAANRMGTGYLKRYGVVERTRTVSEAQIRFATSLSSKDPESCFKYFVYYDGGYCLRQGDIRQITKTLTLQSFNFPSHFISLSPQNDLVHANLYRKSDKKEKVIILVGGAYVSFNPIDQFFAQMFVSSEFDCCVLALPYHGPRSISEKSGLGFIVPDPIAFGEAFIQSVLDVGRLHEILKQVYEYKEIYIVGVSVGGNAALVSTYLKEYDGVALIMTGLPLADIFWQAPYPYAAAVRRKMAERYSLADLRNLWLMSDTSQYQVHPRCEKFLLVGASFDTFVKPQYVQVLKDSLPDAKTLAYPGGHYDSMFFMRRAVRDTRKFFSGEELLPTKSTI